MSLRRDGTLMPSAMIARTSVPGSLPASRSAARNKLWRWLRRDFSDPVSLRQMAAEQRDNIWTQDWPFDSPGALARLRAQVRPPDSLGRHADQLEALFHEVLR